MKSLITKYSLLFASATVALMGCATQPNKLGAADVSPLVYAKYDCDQIGMESDRVTRRINTLYSQLKEEADADEWQMGVGLILLWPTLFWLEGGDGPEATEFRQLKGEYAALQQVSVSKKCGLAFRDIDAELKAKYEADKKAAQAKKAKKQE